MLKCSVLRIALGGQEINKHGGGRYPGRCCALKSQGYPYQKVDPEHIKEGPLAYLMSYFEHLAPSSVYSVSPVILNMGLLDHQECDDNIGESMCFTVTI